MKYVMHIYCAEDDRRWLEDCVRHARQVGTFIDYEESTEGWEAAKKVLATAKPEQKPKKKRRSR